MARVLAAHQPNFLPWLGLLAKAGQADIFVLADDVQYAKHGFANRNRIRTAGGWQWLTVPVRSHGRAGQQIRDVRLDAAQPWPRKHLSTLVWNYSKAPYFEAHAPFLEGVYGARPERLLDLNLALLRYLLAQLGIGVDVRLSSDFDLRTERSQRLADMAVACGCDVYLAGEGGSRRYLDEGILRAVGVEVRYTHFVHPRYPQCHPGFEAGMCGLDLLLNCGPRSREILFG